MQQCRSAQAVPAFFLMQFADCIKLKEVVIGNGITSIVSELFFACDSLEKIVIPDSVTNIGESAFRGCTFIINCI